MSSFGYGQRACLGQNLTQDEMLIACGSLMWGFNLSKKRDANGKEIDIDLGASNSLLIVKPDPFQMAFAPRSEAKRAQVLEQWKEAESKEREAREAFTRTAQLKLHSKEAVTA